MKTNSKYKNVIFDLGGVLVNWKPKETILDVFKNKKIAPIDELIEIWKSGICKDLERGLITQEEAIKKLPERYSKEDFSYFLKEVYKYLFPLEEGLKIFNAVKSNGHKIYVLSNFQEEHFAKASPNYDFLKQVDGIVLSFKVKAMKPEPEIYQALLNNYSLNPEESIFIDDMEENIAGAKIFGIDGIVCKNHDYVLEELRNKGIV